MQRRKKTEITIDAEDLRAIVTIDDRILYKDSNTNELIPTCEDSSLIVDPEELILLLDVGDWLNCPGGPQYVLTKKLLGKYLFFKMCTTYADIEGKRVSEDRERLFSDFQKIKFTAYDPEDMYYISEFCQEERSATKRMDEFFNKIDNFDRASAATRLVTTAIAAMKKSGVEAFMLQADILRLAYCTPNLKGKGEVHVIERLGLNNGTYFNRKREAISNLSRMIFGPTVNGRSFLNGAK